MATINATQLPIRIAKYHRPLISLLLSSPFFLFAIFLYFILQMLKVFFSKASLRENSRYILFAHLMVNDTAYLFSCLLVYALFLLSCAIPTFVCNLLVAIATTTFTSTPIGLAAMSLERYVAICFPLRHSEICRADRSLMAVGLICAIGFLLFIVDFGILISSVNQNFFFQRIVCTHEALLVSTLQIVLRFAAHGSTFAVVALIIIFTYARVALEAKKMKSNKSNSTKARNTVCLHAVQLLLCLASYTYPITETYFENFLLRFFNMIVFLILPRCLSPVIYGLRDEAFKNHVKICLLCCSCKARPKVCKACCHMVLVKCICLTGFP